MRNVTCLTGLLLVWMLAGNSMAQTPGLTGTQIMQQVLQRHQSVATVYEELTLIMTDRLGNRDTRNLRRYSRTDMSGNTRFLLVYDTPVEVRGVALLVHRDVSGQITMAVYLPATGRAEMQQIDAGPDGLLAGTDFSFEQMIGEPPGRYQYILSGQRKLANINHYLIDVYLAGVNIATSRPLRRHYVREDSYYISQTDYLDQNGRLVKQKTLHDLRQDGPQAWHAGMVLMENFEDEHRTLLKINRTIFSEEFVPDVIFTPDWVFLNQPPLILTESTDVTVDNGLIEPVSSAEPQQPFSGTGVEP